MSSFELFMGVAVIAMGIIYLFMGIRGKGIVLKKSEEEKTEEEKNARIQQIQRRYTIVGVAGILVGIIVILLATLWIH